MCAGKASQARLQKMNIAGAEDRRQRTEDRRIKGLGPVYCFKLDFNQYVAAPSSQRNSPCNSRGLCPLKVVGSLNAMLFQQFSKSASFLSGATCSKGDVSLALSQKLLQIMLFKLLDILGLYFL